MTEDKSLDRAVNPDGTALQTLQPQPGIVLRPKTLDAIAQLPADAQPTALAQVSIHAHGELARILADQSLTPDAKRAAVERFREELRSQIEGLPIGEGIKRVIQWLTSFRESGAGLQFFIVLSEDQTTPSQSLITPENPELLQKMIQLDILDPTNPAILIGMMMYYHQAAEQAIAHNVRREFLDLILCEDEGQALTQAQLVILLEACRDADFSGTKHAYPQPRRTSHGIENFNPEVGESFAKLVARELLSFTIREDGIGALSSAAFSRDDDDEEDTSDGFPYGGAHVHLPLGSEEAAESFGPEAVTEIFTEMGENTSRVLRAIMEYDSSLFGSILSEMIRKSYKDESPFISSTSALNKFIAGLLREPQSRATRQRMKQALEAVQLSQGAPPSGAIAGVLGSGDETRPGTESAHREDAGYDFEGLDGEAIDPAQPEADEDDARDDNKGEGDEGDTAEEESD